MLARMFTIQVEVMSLGEQMAAALNRWRWADEHLEALPRKAV